MNNRYREALTEIDEIFNYLPEEYEEQIPNGVRNFIRQNKSQEYVFEIDENIPFENQALRKETKSFIAVLLLKYWDTENKKQLFENYMQNEKKYQDELRQKYNVENMFKNNNSDEREEETHTKLEMIEYKKEAGIVKFFKNIFNFIKKNIAK